VALRRSTVTQPRLSRISFDRITAEKSTMAGAISMCLERGAAAAREKGFGARHRVREGRTGSVLDHPPDKPRRHRPQQPAPAASVRSRLGLDGRPARGGCANRRHRRHRPRHRVLRTLTQSGWLAPSPLRWSPASGSPPAAELAGSTPSQWQGSCCGAFMQPVHVGRCSVPLSVSRSS
jgi:hypothetical protein